MSAFDAAWSLLKAPLLPDTIDWSNVGTRRPVGTFLDPFTEEELGMNVYPMPSGEVEVAIEHKEPPSIEEQNLLPYHLRHRSEANFDRIGADFVLRDGSGFEPYREWEGDYISLGTNTDERYRRRGYASALYDLMALYAEHQGRRLRPSYDQTDEGRALWRSGAGYEGRLDPDKLPFYTRYPEHAEWGTHMVGER